MQENMILEQEQLLFAIDDIDDAQLVAEAAVINTMVELYLRQAMIQESFVDDEAFEAYFQEANKEAAQDDADQPSKFAQFKDKTKGKFAEMGEKIKNFDYKGMLKKILTAVKNMMAAIASGFVKFIKHFNPKYLMQLVRVKSAEITRIAKKEGCKLKVNTDGSVTCMFLMPDFSLMAKWCDKVDTYLDNFKKAVDAIKNGGKGLFAGSYHAPKLPNVNKYQTEEKDDNGNYKWNFPSKWMSVEQFISSTQTGSDKTKLTGESIHIDGLLSRFTKVNHKVDEVIASVNSLPKELYNNRDDNGNILDSTQKGMKGKQRDLKKICDEQVKGLNEILQSSEKLRKVVNSAFMSAKYKAERIRRQLRNPDSELWNKTKYGKARTADAEAYEKAKSDASGLKGKAKSDRLAEIDDEYKKTQDATDAKYARSIANNAKVRTALKFDSEEG